MIDIGYWDIDDTGDRLCLCFRSINGVDSILIADTTKAWHSHIEGGSMQILSEIVRVLNMNRINPYMWTVPKKMGE